MDENTPIENSEKLERVGGGLIKATIYAAISFAIAGIIFWILLYSTEFANFFPMIYARIWYQNTYWNLAKTFLPPLRNTAIPFDPIYTIQTQPPIINGTNIYMLWGKFFKADAQNDLIYLKGFDGNIYTFKVSAKFVEIDNGDINFVKTSFSPSTDIVSLETSSYTKDSIISVQWDDRRTLLNLIKDYSQNKSRPLNSESIELFSLTQYN